MISGGTKGVGRAIAEEYARGGRNMILLSWSGGWRYSSMGWFLSIVECLRIRGYGDRSDG